MNESVSLHKIQYQINLTILNYTQKSLDYQTVIGFNLLV